MCVGLLAGCGGEKKADDSSKNSDKKGSVYYLNFKPEQDEAWQNLAKAYTKETGVKVTVVTAASGEYETTLMAEMGKSDAPTLFQVNGPVGLENWKDFILSVTDRLVVALLLYRLFVRPIHTAGWQGTSLRGTGSENNRVCQLNVGAQRGIQRSGEKYGKDT